jgi:hypothetical protein
MSWNNNMLERKHDCFHTKKICLVNQMKFEFHQSTLWHGSQFDHKWLNDFIWTIGTHCTLITIEAFKIDHKHIRWVHHILYKCWITQKSLHGPSHFFFFFLFFFFFSFHERTEIFFKIILMIKCTTSNFCVTRDGEQA